VTEKLGSEFLVSEIRIQDGRMHIDYRFFATDSVNIPRNFVKPYWFFLFFYLRAIQITKIISSTE